MAKTQAAERITNDKDTKEKGDKVLMRRVKKAVRKSRRKLSEEKFEKELNRTIAFLETLQHKINGAPAGEAASVAAPEPPANKKSKDQTAKTKPKTKPKKKVKAKPSASAPAPIGK